MKFCAEWVARVVFAFSSLVFAGSAVAGYAPFELIKDGDQLIGAKSVVVSGGTYDVSFEDGTCLMVFGQCDVPAFAFTNRDVARSASQALLDRVFVGIYDTTPGLTRGCSGAPEVCIVFTPFGVLPDYGVTTSMSLNYIAHPNVSDEVGNNSLNSFDLDLSLNRSLVWAKWSLAEEIVTATVPEPTSLALLGLAGVALGWSQRRRPQAGKPV